MDQLWVRQQELTFGIIMEVLQPSAYKLEDHQWPNLHQHMEY
jgi:hypothetical protein